MSQAASRQQEVWINGEPRHVEPGLTVAGLLQELEMGQRRVAIAINRDVVPRSGYESRRLDAGDRIEILEAVGGG